MDSISLRVQICAESGSSCKSIKLTSNQLSYMSSRQRGCFLFPGSILLGATKKINCRSTKRKVNITHDYPIYKYLSGKFQVRVTGCFYRFDGHIPELFLYWDSAWGNGNRVTFAPHQRTPESQVYQRGAYPIHPTVLGAAIRPDYSGPAVQPKYTIQGQYSNKI